MAIEPCSDEKQTLDDGDSDFEWGLVASIEPTSLYATELLVDSGCYDNCCPPDFAPECPILPAPEERALAANKAKLIHYGKKIVHGWMVSEDDKWQRVSIRFNVFDVKRAILSTMKLAKKGYIFFHGPNGHYIQQGSDRVKMFEKNGLPYVKFWIDSGSSGAKLVAPIQYGGATASTDAIPRVTTNADDDSETFAGVGGDMISDKEAQRARGILVPKGPSAAERTAHELTHLPYRTWCEFCVKGRAKESPHTKVTKDDKLKGDDWPVVQADYAFMHNFGDKDNKVTMLTVVDTESGATVATACPKKGHDPFVERVVRSGLESFGLMSDLIIQTDKEHGPMDVMRRVAAMRKSRMQLRRTPKGSSASNAFVERMHQTLEAMVRTMKEVIESKCGVKLRSDGPLITWMIRHASWLVTRFSVGEDGRTAFQRQHNVPYSGKVLAFGSKVEAKINDQEMKRSKFDTTFVTGVYLGRAIESDEHCVGTKRGVVSVRTVRPYDADNIWNATVIGEMKGTPWNLDGSDGDNFAFVEVEPEFLPQKGGDLTTQAQNLREFWTTMGKTAGCKACENPGGRHHSNACKRRQMTFRADKDKEEKSNTLDGGGPQQAAEAAPAAAEVPRVDAAPPRAQGASINVPASGRFRSLRLRTPPASSARPRSHWRKRSTTTRRWTNRSH